MIDIGYLNDSEQSEFSSRITAICNLEEVQPTKAPPVFDMFWDEMDQEGMCYSPGAEETLIHI